MVKPTPGSLVCSRPRPFPASGWRKATAHDSAAATNADARHCLRSPVVPSQKQPALRVGRDAGGAISWSSVASVTVWMADVVRTCTPPVIGPAWGRA